MEDPLHIMIVGHDLQTKCNVANAFIKQKNGFKQFLCRQNLLLKKIVGTKATTVAGRTLYIVLTPNLNTPAWTHMTDGILRRYKHKVFIYVKSPGHVKVNDDKSIETIRSKFGMPVEMITYFRNAVDAELTRPDNEYIHAKMSFNDRTAKVNKLLSAVCKAFQSKISDVRYVYRGPDEIGPSQVVQKKSVETKTSSSEGSSEDTSESREQDLERQNTSDLDLQDIVRAEDWDLLNRTLRYGKAKSNHVRVNIIGNQGAGKTTLVSRLHDLDVKCPDGQLRPTEALEINELSSRCIEVGEEKHWETNMDGYIDDLNVQRMAQAMKSVQADLEGSNSDSDIKEENFDTTAADYTLASYIEEEIEVHEEEPYSAINKEQSRILYMKQILRKKNHSRGERMYISYWDFAGQSTYYSTHQVFMSPSAVYVLVVDLSVDFNEKLSDSLNFRTGIIKDCSVAESLMFWISSIKAFTTDAKGGSAPVLIVGTHVDKVKQNAENAEKKNRNPEEVISEKFDKVREILKMSEIECIAIDNADPDISDLVALRNRILELGLGVIDEEIPAQWIDLERRIQEQKTKGKVIMTFDDLVRLDEGMDVPMSDKARLEAFLGHQHNRGHLIHFLHANLRDLIILEPDVLAKFLNNLMRSRDSDDQKGMKQHTSMYNHNGIINRNYVDETAKMITEYEGIKNSVDKLLNMLVHLSVIRPYKFENNDTRYLLPCLLPDKPYENTGEASIETRSFQVVFPNNHMPPTFYHILVGGLLNEWKPIEKAVDTPEIYNLYACFRLDMETHQMEIYWKESRVYIDIQNYSTKKDLTTDQIFEILDIVKKRIVKIFRVYRHTNTNYEIRVMCPTHRESFISLSTLKKDGEAMCYHEQKHAVDFEYVFGKTLLAKKNPSCFKRKPRDKDLGRLATYLVRETATSLASRLRIYLGLVEADRAAQSNLDESNRRLYILYRWRGSNGSENLEDLIDLLTVTKDYQMEDLQNLLEGHPKRRNYDVPDEKLDIIQDNKCDLRAAADSVGALYPFLMLELGLYFNDIEVTRANNQNDMKTIILTLLGQWRQQHPENCTTRNLLDTASFVGIDTTQIQKVVKRS